MSNGVIFVCFCINKPNSNSSFISLDFVSDASALLEDGTQSPSKQYKTALPPSGSEGDDENVDDDDDAERLVLNTDRLRDLPPRDILARAFHGKPSYFWVLIFRRGHLFIRIFYVLEQPIQLDPRTPTFLLGLEQVIALVDASGKRVGNQVSDRLTQEKVFSSTYCSKFSCDFSYTVTY